MAEGLLETGRNSASMSRTLMMVVVVVVVVDIGGEGVRIQAWVSVKSQWGKRLFLKS